MSGPETEEPSPQSSPGSDVWKTKPFFDRLEKLLAHAAVGVIRLAPGETVFSEGDPGDTAYFIRKGSVDILTTGQDGTERKLQVLGAGELFGEMALLDRTWRSASAVTREMTRLFVVTRDDVIRLLRQEPQMALWMLGLSSHRLRVLTRMVSEMEQAQEVNLKILAGQEEERRRIGRDIHDGVAHSFAESILRVQSALLLLDRDPEKARSVLEDLEHGLRDGIETIRELIGGLFSKELRMVGLVGAIHQFLKRVGGCEELQIAFEHRGLENELPAALEATLFFLVQEALTNVRRHAGASEVRIDLSHGDAVVALIIEDDGCGFDLGMLVLDPNKQSSYGLLSMQERVQLAGGTMDVNTRPGAGTRLHFSLPVRAPKA